MRFAVIITIFTLLVILTHTYLYRRFIRDTLPRPRARRIGAILFALAGLGLIIALPLARALPRTPGEWVGLLAFTWMGIVALTVPLLAFIDLLRTLYTRTLATRPSPTPNTPADTHPDPHPDAPADPARRLAIARGVATATAIGATLTTAHAVEAAIGPPDLRELTVPLARFGNLRIVQVTDIHVGPTIGRPFVEAMVTRINALNADLVVITGDLVDGTVARLGEHTAPLGTIKSRLGTYFVTGNHEYYSGVDPWCAELRRLGITVLRNQRVTLHHNARPFDLIGVDDWRGDYDIKTATLGRDPSIPAILLSHQPKAIHDAARHGIDLMLAGHTHGGQLWPFRFIVQLIQPYVDGLHHHIDRTWIYVHPGTGYWGPPMRLAVPAEIALITVT